MPKKKNAAYGRMAMFYCGYRNNPVPALKALSSEMDPAEIRLIR